MRELNNGQVTLTIRDTRQRRESGDNLWEWCRLPEYPSRQRCVCARPSAELASQLGGFDEGVVYYVRQLSGEKMRRSNNRMRTTIPR